MNRSILGDKLKEAGLKLELHKRHNGVYHVYTRPNEWNVCRLHTEYFTIHDFDSIYLCANEILVTGKFDNMNINIPYHHLDFIKIEGFYDNRY